MLWRIYSLFHWGKLLDNFLLFPLQDNRKDSKKRRSMTRINSVASVRQAEIRSDQTSQTDLKKKLPFLFSFLSLFILSLRMSPFFQLLRFYDKSETLSSSHIDEQAFPRGHQGMGNKSIPLGYAEVLLKKKWIRWKLGPYLRPLFLFILLS